MFEYSTRIRVRYGETDQMGYMYYGNYALYYEVARVEMMRSTGITYRSMEISGIMLPVLELKVKYLRPAYYDEEITVKVIMDKLPGIKMHLRYELYNETSQLINTGETTLAFINTKTNRPCLPPEDFLNTLRAYF